MDECYDLDLTGSFDKLNHMIKGYKGTQNFKCHGITSHRFMGPQIGMHVACFPTITGT